MKTFLKILLFILVWSLITLAAAFGALLLNRPVASGITVAVYLFLIWLAFRVGRWGWIRWRARARAKRLLQEGEPEAAPISSAETQALDASFKEVIRYLESAPEVDKNLDPRYALPWYLLLGERQQTRDLLQAARIPLPTDAEKRLNSAASAISWWPYNDNLLVQVSPHVFQNPEQQNPEWQRLLNLLSQKRREEPINGLLLPLDWQWLENSSEDDLFEEGLKLRDQLGQMMKSIQTRFPVYFVITGLEKLEGIDDWQEQLPEHLKEQAIGRLNQQRQEADDFVEQSIVEMAERLKDLNIFMLRGGKISTGALVLPTRLNELGSRLRQFAKGVFQESIFEELPTLRGVYLASTLPDKEGSQRPQGLFCQHLLTQILASERNQTERVPAAVRAEKAVRNLWISGYAVLIFAVLLSLAYVYRQDTRFLQDMTDRYAGNLVVRSDFNSNLDVNGQLANLNQQLEEHNFLPWLNSFTSTPDFQKRLERILLQRIEQNLIQPLDRQLQVSAERKLFEGRLSGDELGQEMARFVGQLVREVNLLQARLDGAGMSELQSLPPAYSQADDPSLEGLDVSQMGQLNQLYLEFLDRQPEDSKLEARLENKRSYLQRILAQSPGSLDWLIDWGNQAAMEAEVSLGEFWRGIRTEDDVRVPAAFTAQGKEMIDDFISQLLATHEEDLELDQVNHLIPGFKESYRARYLEAWKQFALNFQKGVDVLSGPNNWRDAVDLQATTRNQHFAVLDRMAEELKPFMDDDAPEWVFLIELHQEMKAFGPDETGADRSGLQRIALRMMGKAGKIGKALAKAGKSAAKAQAKAGGPTRDEQEILVERAADILGEYRHNIREMTKESQVRSLAHLSMLDLYANPDDPSQGQTSLAEGYRNLQDLQGLLGRNTDFNEPFWAVFRGPLNMFRRYKVQESAYQLQELWEENFLAATDGVPQERMADYLYGDSGLLWEFSEEHLSTFVRRRYGAGYRANLAFGTPYPVNSELLTYLAKADEFRKQNQDYYSVILSTRPTSVNPGAQQLPSRTLLELQCEDGVQEVENFNYRVDAEFTWTQDCGTVRLTIQVDSYSLVKQYRGPYGFPEFLEEFRDGSRRFEVSEFPLYEERLAEWDIRYFDVQFGLRGHGKVIDVLSASRQRLPRTIIR
ncbi:ImcF-related N-terminal domain-containing protein [Marinospirillum celere]|uniref:ImcF-related N-terminal domain-containing protein n=1 Tax=Marinospirillum celere TaxID=1122252 RepID=A0A1I1H3J4_9GAMM|nr:type VI secretion protein IcmF/TssM N-terminal domain-containing protein [Marinospirillum celere]SFC18729.1 ImcF-related N-terminal domain-containing protein [Marinospirillum celere]